MPELIEIHADELSTYVPNVSFKDENSDPVIPNNAKWTLQDMSGVVINSKLDEAITSPAASEDIKLAGDDLALSTAEVATGIDKFMRELTIEYEYDSSLGLDNPGVESIYFWIDRIGGHHVTT